MTLEEFEKIVVEEWPRAMPDRYMAKVSNVALLIEQEPSPEVRAKEGLEGSETLLGYYQGIPHTARGGDYGYGFTLPDTITLYKKPILKEAKETDGDIARVVRETIWHEVAHHFGIDEDEVRRREDDRTLRNG